VTARPRLGQLRGSFGFTEPGGDVPRTVAVKDGDELLVTGHKSFVTGGDSANYVAALVNLREADGVTKAGTAGRRWCCQSASSRSFASMPTE
jgi:alkylation response protein AidB-like acyl-CoA dehydrogenase